VVTAGSKRRWDPGSWKPPDVTAGSKRQWDRTGRGTTHKYNLSEYFASAEKTRKNCIIGQHSIQKFSLSSDEKVKPEKLFFPNCVLFI
jgi:hypothetical protein